MHIAMRMSEAVEAAPGAADVAALTAAEAATAQAAAHTERLHIEVTLWRADAVAAVVEVDSHMEITRAETAAGLIFGVGHRTLLKKDFRK